MNLTYEEVLLLLTIMSPTIAYYAELTDAASVAKHLKLLALQSKLDQVYTQEIKKAQLLKTSGIYVGNFESASFFKDITNIIEGRLDY